MSFLGTGIYTFLAQAESVMHHLGVSVLLHNSLKPSYQCIKDIDAYYASLSTPVRRNQMVIVGDRIFTDIILANRMRSHSSVGRRNFRVTPDGPIGIFTDEVWRRESMLARHFEKAVVRFIDSYLSDDNSLEATNAMRRTFTHVPP